MDALFVDECLDNHRIFSFLRNVLEKASVNAARDRKNKICQKKTWALYEDNNHTGEADIVHSYHGAKQSRRNEQGTGASNHRIVTKRLERNNQHTLGRNKSAVASSFKEENKYF